MESLTIPMTTLSTIGLWSFVGLIAILLIAFLRARTAVSGFKYLWVIIIVGILGMLTYVFIKSWHSTVNIIADDLVFNVPFYHKTLPLTDVQFSKISTIDLSTSKAIKLDYRQNGIGLPGYQLGYYRLQRPYHEISMALVSVTEPSKVIVVPTTENLLLIFSVDNPEDVVEQLNGFSPF
ncbi:hypothetical protein D5R81_03995 [Parashewanella spongiae]|uniref:Bacterial Pleckstrin homology domain-containing protein n=1 Tax=Parashewanella spongiae TaxID=342950 RepID=A0A3A6U9X7_9GAMM|nr:hypothetical protein [Parashewanella spongiae]MCL1077026.1 hypothetical protein [Parashewanella spongiae]RJY18760.1 hypothetical protein D5R81_03995 [Parashewanella spongiae]